VTPKDVRTALEGHQLVDVPALPGRTNHLESAVLVPLAWEDEVTAVATVRPEAMRAHAGEVCFPGGTPEEGDADLQATALREAHEELGIEGAEVLGRLSSIPLYTSDYRLFPFVARVDATNLVVNEAEVAEVLRFSVPAVLAQERIDALFWKAGKLSGLSPLFRVAGHVMYGATAHVFHELLHVLAPLFETAVPPMETCELTWADLLPASFTPPER
jgi:8-oxo-dGTP pyrophosphatase MutT (NUDIX family)